MTLPSLFSKDSVNHHFISFLSSLLHSPEPLDSFYPLIAKSYPAGPPVLLLMLASVGKDPQISHLMIDLLQI